MRSVDVVDVCCNAFNFVLVSLLQNKKERKKVREVGILKKDPDTLKDQIQKLEAMSKSLRIIYCCIV